MSERLYGGIEAGGTKFVCTIAAGPDDILAEERFPTRAPEETLAQAIAFFRAQPPIAAVGIGAFGPADPDPHSPTFGTITTTPKPGWANVDFAGAIRRALGVPVGFDTDVNVAALGEWRWGAAQGLDTFVYLTIGTGIGGGGVVNGQMMHGLIHPEMGHMRLPRREDRLPYGALLPAFAGICPYHGDCLEGLAAGPAIESRWGQNAATLPPDHPAWAIEAHYLGLALSNLVCILSPQRIILGGGVMEQRHLFPLIHAEVRQTLNGYVASPAVMARIADYIVPPGLGNRAGMLGAIALAQQTARAAQ
ncbi:MAG: ROK family protein [Ardenticatenales bacterium]|nr:ROK family protein [Ardenticatenales bacterium]